jgi:4-hydroxybenzoate polyprenyltransferase
MTAPLPDAAATNWVDRYAPRALQPWLKLGRFDRPTGIWLLMLPGWQAIALAGAERGRWPSLYLLAAFFVGAALMRAAGCAFNDIVDRDFDAQVARTAGRPIPSGQISVKQAWGFVFVCAMVSLAILITMGTLAIILGVGSLLLVAGYPFMKRITWWPQAWLGLTFNWGALLGYAAATGEVSLSALALYASGIFWTLGYDTIYAVQDLEDDALAGVKSSARRLGSAAARGVEVFYAIAVLFAGVAIRLGGLSWKAIPFLVVYAGLLWWQSRKLKLDDPALALALFKANVPAALVLFAGLVAGRA